MTGAAFREFVGEIRDIQDPKGKDGDLMKSVGNLSKFRLVKEKLKVLARSSPDDKYLLTTGL